MPATRGQAYTCSGHRSMMHVHTERWMGEANTAQMHARWMLGWYTWHLFWSMNSPPFWSFLPSFGDILFCWSSNDFSWRYTKSKFYKQNCKDMCLNHIIYNIMCTAWIDSGHLHIYSRIDYYIYFRRKTCSTAWKTLMASMVERVNIKEQW